jgi:hypothetical protein
MKIQTWRSFDSVCHFSLLGTLWFFTEMCKKQFFPIDVAHQQERFFQRYTIWTKRDSTSDDSFYILCPHFLNTKKSTILTEL